MIRKLDLKTKAIIARTIFVLSGVCVISGIFVDSYNPEIFRQYLLDLLSYWWFKPVAFVVAVIVFFVYIKLCFWATGENYDIPGEL